MIPRSIEVQITPQLINRFWAKVEKTSNCWNWKGCKVNGGYGRFAIRNPSSTTRVVLAHRMAWTLTYGAIPDEEIVCHTCDNPACCRPDHLFLGTHLTNAKDKIAKGRAADVAGERNGHAKLTSAQVREIWQRHHAGETALTLSQEFDITRNTVYDISKNKTWKYTTGR